MTDHVERAFLAAEAAYDRPAGLRARLGFGLGSGAA